MILKLEEEMKKIKLQLEKDILSERQRANEAEHKASLVARAEEQRVADLGRYLCVNTVLRFCHSSVVFEISDAHSKFDLPIIPGLRMISYLSHFNGFNRGEVIRVV